MREESYFPRLSIVIPTLNAERVLEGCLESLFMQDYPADRMEILIVDGGSEDGTKRIIRSYAARGTIRTLVLKNPLKTAEAGKAVGVRAARGDIIVLIDSDNILPARDWMMRLAAPFRDKEIIASEPLEYTYRREDGLITRYCALLGMNDPFCLFRGNYDRFCHLTGKWTGMPVRVEEKGAYLKVRPSLQDMPTFGANGFLIRRRDLLGHFSGDYLFDTDILVEIGRKKRFFMAKVKIGIVHIFSGDMPTFLKKQRRRIRDYLHFRNTETRSYPWMERKGGVLKFIVYCLLVFPLVLQSVAGYVKKRDRAWGFHPVACWITLCVYTVNTVLYSGRSAGVRRNHW